MTKPLVPSPEQKKIISCGLDTIRVRAGAGTGKTTTVAMVIANLVATLGIGPEQIMGITFTNKAAAELSDRVRQTLETDLGPGAQIEVHTYHGFAAQVLSEFGALAGVDSRAKVITPTFGRQLLSTTFASTSYDSLDITQTRTLDRIRRLGDRLGDHLLDAGDVLALEDIDADEIWAARLEMAETLRRYAEDKRDLRLVDYSDLVTFSTRIVREFPDVAGVIRARYSAVVLDEYQDTNPAQRVLLSTIFGDGFPVVAVGDEDQTIYEWRGASAENFERFSDHFSGPGGTPARDEGLTLNRRSAGKILQVANEIRSRANPGADRLAAADRGISGEVETHWADDALGEAEWIARRFEECHEAGLPWSEMAVLFRKNRDFPMVVDALSRHEIPLEVANIGGLFSVPEVAELRAWLTILERPEDSGAMTQILLGSRYQLGLADLAPLTRWVTASADFDDSEEPEPITLIVAIEAADRLPGVRAEARAALIRFHDIYRHVLTESQGQSLVEICRTVLDSTRAWQDVEALPANRRLTARLNLYRLLDLAEDWSPLRGRPSLGAFLDYLRAMEEEPAEELDSAHLSGEEAVTLVTVHRAKGLEWDTVAIPAVTRGNFPSKSQQFPDPFRFPEHIPIEMRIDNVVDALPVDREERDAYFRERHAIQEWRVAYVAVTRPKRRLLVSGAHWYGLPEPSKTAREPSELFEIVAAHPVSSGTVPTGEPIPRPPLLRSPGRTDAPDPLFEEGWLAAVRSTIADPGFPTKVAAESGVRQDYERIMDDMTQRLFRLAEPTAPTEPDSTAAVSVTGLVTYARCPKRFFWTDIDPLPRKPSSAARRGTEIHRRIELHQRGQIPFDELEEDLYDMAGEDRLGGAGAYEVYLGSRFAETAASLVEAPFTVETDNGYRVRGRIDAIYRHDQKWEIVDFKSGRPSTDPSRLVQLQAYAVAATEVDLGLPPPGDLDVTFAFLGGELIEETHHADSPWVTAARRTLDDITSRMAAEDYPERPGPWCSGCDFLRFCPPGQAEVGR